jgi:hypothetical protein
MNNVVAFPQSLLEPFLGTWIRDPISVSRNKLAKRMLGEDGLKLLWGRGSMADVHQCLRNDVALAEKYDALCRLGAEGRVVIARRTMTWIEMATAQRPAATVEAPIAGVTAEGRMVIVHDSPRQTVSGHALRRKDEWLLISERYSGLNAVHFPRSPVFRYYRAEQDELSVGPA